MSRRNVLAAKRIGFAEHCSPFDLAITLYARVWRLSVKIGIGKVIDDLTAKFFRHIGDVMLNAEHRRNSPGIVDTIERATGGIVRRVATNIFVFVGLNGHTDNVMAFLPEQRRRYRGIQS